MVELRKAIDADNFDGVRFICQSLKGTGKGYGFPALSDAGAAAVISLDASCSVAESLPEVQRVLSICARLIPECETRRAAAVRRSA
jgi:hypothetical protein